MIERLRTFLAVLEEGSVNRASRRLGVPQPTLSRQIQALEAEVGGSLLERGSWGVRATDLGFKLREKMLPVIKAHDQAWAEVQASARGREAQLRVGYLGSTAHRFLTKPLEHLRNEFPRLRLWLFDQTPVEQLEALRKGELDVAIIGQEGAALADDFYKRKAARLPVCVAVASGHPLAAKQTISLADLADETFVGVAESTSPGRNEWIGRLCRRAGFKPRFVAKTTAINDTFTLIGGEGAVALLPAYSDRMSSPGIVFVPIAEKWATWDLYVLRQRGRGNPASRRLVELIM